MKVSLMAGASSFASLLGRGVPKAAAAESDDDKKRDNESDEDYAKRMEEKDDKKKEEESAAKKAEEDDKKKKDEEESAKKAAESGDDEGDDNSDDEDMRNKGTRSARMRERARIATIFSAAAADTNIKQAMVIALTTSLPRTQGVALLNAGAAVAAPPAPASATPARVTLADRMASQVDIRLGANPGSGAPDMTTAKGVAAFALAAYGLSTNDSK
jgi:hypothetical protein